MNCRQINAQYYCGADLHARTTYVCVMDNDGQILLRRNLPNNFEKFKQIVTPFLPDLAVGAESTFSYYWLADGCKEAEIAFYLGLINDNYISPSTTIISPHFLRVNSAHRLSLFLHACLDSELVPGGSLAD